MKIFNSKLAKNHAFVKTQAEKRGNVPCYYVPDICCPQLSLAVCLPFWPIAPPPLSRTWICLSKRCLMNDQHFTSKRFLPQGSNENVEIIRPMDCQIP